MDMVKVTIHNFKKYNPRSDVSQNSWIRIERDIFSSPSLFGLSSTTKWLWICLLGIASKKGGEVESSTLFFSKTFDISEENITVGLKEFEKRGLIELSGLNDTILTTQAPVTTEDVTHTLRTRYEDVRQTYHTNERTNERTNESAERKTTSKTKKSKSINSEFDALAWEVVQYLNKKSGSNFKNSDSSKQFIIARFRQGHDINSMFKVIDSKCSEWLFNPKMKYCLRPKTLFCESNFETYKAQLDLTTIDEIDLITNYIEQKLGEPRDESKFNLPA